MTFSAAVSCGCAAFAQEPVETAQQAPAPQGPQQIPTPPGTVQPCVQPPPMLEWKDYDGPYQKLVGILARKVERGSVHAPHYKPGAVLCTLTTKDKFLLFLHDGVDPLTFLGVAFNAGIDQAQDNDPTFGQGAAGYGKRFAADYADRTSAEFFKDFAYPTLFHEDPRYYRLAHGSGRKRFFHALEHVFVAHRENGTRMFNLSEWLGTASAVALSNTYHPGNDRGFWPAAQRVGIGISTDMGFDVLREFWPELARKLHLPFRGQNDPNEKGANW